MKTLSLFLYLLIFLIFTAASVVPAQKKSSPQMAGGDWVGTYEYEQVFSRNSNSGYADSIQYVLIISQKGDSLSARFTADGVQTSNDYECSVKATGNRLEIYYLKDLKPADSQESNGRLRKDELLGTLFKTTTRGRAKYIFKDKTYFGSKLSPVFKKKK